MSPEPFPPAPHAGPPASAPSPTETAPSGEAVPLSGWRLRLAWTGLVLLVAWGAAANVRALPVYLDTIFRLDAAFWALHVDASWGPGGEVEPFGDGVAEQAGMPKGRLVAVDRQPLAEDAPFRDAATLVLDTPGDVVRLSVVTAEGDTVTVAVPRTAAPPPELATAGFGVAEFFRIHIGLGLLFYLGFLVAAAVLAARRRRSGVALLGAAAFTAVGLLNEYVAVAAVVEGTHVSLLSRLLPEVFLTAFLVGFPDGRVRLRWAWAALGVLGVDAVLAGTGVESGGLELALMVLWVGLLAAAQVVRYRRISSGVGRQQTKWAMLGIVLGMASALVIVGFLSLPAEDGTAWEWQRILIADAMWLGFLLVPAGVVLALLRYRLWDAEAAWSRSAMAAALVLALTAIIAGGTALMQTALGASGPLAIGLATVAAAVFFIPLQDRLGDWADRRFLRDLIDLKAGLPDLVNHLRETESVEGIAEAVTDRVGPVVHATHAALVVPDGEGWRTVGVDGIDPASADAWAVSAGLSDPPAMAPRRQPWREVVWRKTADRRFPVRVALRSERAGGEMVVEGWLALGPRPDGSGYGPDDLEAVAEVAGAVGRALRVVGVREAREAARTGALEALGAELREIRAALDP